MLSLMQNVSAENHDGKLEAKPLSTNISNDIDKNIGWKVIDKSDNVSWCPFMNDMESTYEKLVKVGQGTYGEVFKAKHRRTRQLVALKKVLMSNEKEGFPITALREIKILQHIKHENVVNLIEICKSKEGENRSNRVSFYMVFDFCEHDLAGLLGNPKVVFTIAELKQILKQMLNGLFFIHSNGILHRDMKAANILITKKGVLKVADFGLARALKSSTAEQPEPRYTNRVVTLWYRPPELLLGERNYGPAIDMWGVGCIMAELWTRSPILQGTSEQDQLFLITQMCGPITPSTMPGVERLELYNKLELPKHSRRKVKERMRPYIRDALGLDLLDKFLAMDPQSRIDCDTALDHDFFWTPPLPTDLAPSMAKFNQSMFEFVLNHNQYDMAQARLRMANGRQANKCHSVPNATRLENQYHDRIF